jgi:SAGA-associated factor 73
MNGLANWNPQPVVQPEPQITIQRKYQKEALYEQLRQATNNFTVNICKVKHQNGYGYQKLPPGHPGLLNPDPNEVDAEGEVDGEYGFQGADYRRQSNGFNMQLPPSRRASMASQASQRPA